MNRLKSCILKISSGVAYVSSSRSIDVLVENIGEPGDFSITASLCGLRVESDIVHIDRMKSVNVSICLQRVGLKEPVTTNVFFEVGSSGTIVTKSSKLMTLVPEGWYYNGDCHLADSLISSLSCIEATPKSSIYDDAMSVFNEMSWYECVGVRNDLFFRVNPPDVVIKNGCGNEVEIAILFMQLMLKKGHMSRLYWTPGGCFVCVSNDSNANFPDDYLVVRPSDASKKYSFDESIKSSKLIIMTSHNILKGNRYISKIIRPLA